MSVTPCGEYKDLQVPAISLQCTKGLLNPARLNVMKRCDKTMKINLFRMGDMSSRLDRDERILFLESRYINGRGISFVLLLIPFILGIYLWFNINGFRSSITFGVIVLCFICSIHQFIYFFKAQRIMVTNKGVYPHLRSFLDGIKNKKYFISISDIECVEITRLRVFRLVNKKGKKLPLVLDDRDKDDLIKALDKAGIEIRYTSKYF